VSDERKLLGHFLAVLAYRTQKALRDAPDEFGSFRAAEGVRTPTELIHHMTRVLGYARNCFVKGSFKPDPPAGLDEEVTRFHTTLEALARHLEGAVPLRQGISVEKLLQGPLADAMTHAGQLAMLRRLAGSPVAPESFIDADISAQRLGPDQASPLRQLDEWPDAPRGWVPPSGHRQ
jgi:hypothetical protein